MNFDTYGPFDLDFRQASEYDRWRARFWISVGQRYGEDCAASLKSAIGCYVFCLANGVSIKPWYVGKTVSKAGFIGEIFQKHKIDHYRSIKEKRRGRSLIFLFPLVQNDSWDFCRDRSQSSAINWLERTLIGMAIAKNPDIANDRDTKIYRNIWVNGLLGKQNSGRRHPEAVDVRRAFLVKTKK